ncbi:hypothetical protein M3Y96_00904600 [Aphelenchoides besseyi]|nr:hypothetical protein M3Y96_00904600 [Aphelenchoides besseyi]
MGERQTNGVKKAYPLFYILLENKTAATYERVFNYIEDLWPELQPQNVVCDFEKAIHVAIESTWPDVNVHGCWFHLMQLLRTHVAQLGAKSSYDSDANFKWSCKMIAAMSFVPLDEIDRLWTELVEHLNSLSLDDVQTNAILGLISWFETNYIGEKKRNGRRVRPRMFAHEIWNMHERTLQDDSRTNNFSESAHQALNKFVGFEHPSVLTLIEKLQNLQLVRDDDMDKHLALSQSHSRKRPLAVETRHEAIKQIVAEGFGNRMPMEYLKSLVRNF